MPIADCTILLYIGIFCILLFLCSFVVNVLLLWVFYKTKKLRTLHNVPLIILTIVNLTATVLEMPLITTNAFFCRFLYGLVGCYLEGTFMFFVGCANIYLIMTLSIGRYLVLAKHARKVQLLTRQNQLVMITVCLSLSLLWCALPIIGWSNYSLEGIKISCSIEWNVKTVNGLTYSILTLLLVYILPLSILIFTNTKMVSKVKASERRLMVHNKVIRRRITKETHMITVTILLIGFFIISWTPYAVISMYKMFGDARRLSPLLVTSLALFGKSSIVWPAFLNICINQEIRRKLFERRRKTNKLFLETKNMLHTAHTV